MNQSVVLFWVSIVAINLFVISMVAQFGRLWREKAGWFYLLLKLLYGFIMLAYIVIFFADAFLGRDEDAHYLYGLIRTFSSGLVFAVYPVFLVQAHGITLGIKKTIAVALAGFTWVFVGSIICIAFDVNSAEGSNCMLLFLVVLSVLSWLKRSKILNLSLRRFASYFIILNFFSFILNLLIHVPLDQSVLNFIFNVKAAIICVSWAVFDFLPAPKPVLHWFDLLTPREQEIADLLARGETAKSIAAELEIAVRTAETHIQNLYRKAGQGKREAFVQAWRQIQT